jgi:6-pyruvoyltetrahydropterin/6-carboxytetrahydropterin synthase
MATVRITKEFSFEMAHALSGYDGVCSEIHGHSYRLFVTIAGVPEDDPANPKYGMVMDFGELKRTVNETVVAVYDHALLLRDIPANESVIVALKEHFARIMAVDYQPTCENIVLRFAALIAAALPSGVRLHSIRLHETATSYAEWFAADNH